MSSESILIGLLNAAPELVADGVTAYGAVPAQRPDRFVTVERTGGQRDRLMDRPTWAVQCWGAAHGPRSARSDAADMADMVADVIIRRVALDGRVARVDVTTSYHFPDPDSGQERTQLVVTGVLMLV
jgi:hypothetical protein